MSTFLKDYRNRRSYYALTSDSTISDERINEIVETVIKYGPSAFNSQSSRIVLLLGKQHLRFWEIVEEVLRKQINNDKSFASTKNKIDTMFRSGHGTILFYEDQEVVLGLQSQYPQYAANMPVHSTTAGGMHQLAVWISLEAEGLGASLQHYNPVIDKEVAEAFGIPSSWELKAQMPFGKPSAQPGPKSFKPLDQRIMVLK